MRVINLGKKPKKTLEFRLRGRHVNEVVGIRYDTGKKWQRQDI